MSDQAQAEERWYRGVDDAEPEDTREADADRAGPRGGVRPENAPTERRRYNRRWKGKTGPSFPDHREGGGLRLGGDRRGRGVCPHCGGGCCQEAADILNGEPMERPGPLETHGASMVAAVQEAVGRASGPEVHLHPDDAQAAGIDGRCGWCGRWESDAGPDERCGVASSYCREESPHQYITAEEYAPLSREEIG